MLSSSKLESKMLNAGSRWKSARSFWSPDIYMWFKLQIWTVGAVGGTHGWVIWSGDWWGNVKLCKPGCAAPQRELGIYLFAQRQVSQLRHMFEQGAWRTWQRKPSVFLHWRRQCRNTEDPPPASRERARFLILQRFIDGQMNRAAERRGGKETLQSVRCDVSCHLSYVSRIQPFVMSHWAKIPLPGA